MSLRDETGSMRGQTDDLAVPFGEKLADLWDRFSGAALHYFVLFCLIAFFLFPLLWMVLTSLKTNLEALAYPPQWIFTPTFENYVSVFRDNPFLTFLMNSTIVSVCAVGISLVLGLPAAYAISRSNYRQIGFLFLAVRILPGIIFLLPLFMIYRQLGLINTIPGIVIAHLVIALPLIVWIMIGFFESIPVELEESALIDGCTRVGVFLRIVLPLSKPGIVAAAILASIESWNNLIFALILGGRDTMTLPAAVYNFISFEEVNWGGLTAAATLITLPVLILSLFVQKHLAGGLTVGAVKG